MYNQCLDYLNKAKEISEILIDRYGNQAEKGGVLGNIGETYMEIGDYQKALIFLQEGLQLNLL